jgi:hypothetical protein
VSRFGTRPEKVWGLAASMSMDSADVSKVRENLPRRTRRGFMIRALLRPTATATCVLVVYFALPLHRQFTAVTAVLLAAGLMLLVAIIVWQARAIYRSPYPRLQAVEALAMSVPLFLVLFATGYYLMEGTEPGAFSEQLTRVDALYFTITVFATVGFGDIVPLTQSARVLTMVQMLGDLLIIGLAARVLVTAVQRSIDRRARDSGAGGDPP